MHIKNFKTSLLVFMILSAIAESSIAADWEKVVVAAKYCTIYIEMQSLSRTGSKVKVWEKWVYERPQKDLISVTKRPYQSSKQLCTFLCDERRYAILQIIHYADKKAKSDRLATTSYTDTPSDYMNIVPKTVTEGLLDFVCKFSASKSR